VYTEEQKVSLLKEQIWTYPYPHQTPPDHFETEFGNIPETFILQYKWPISMH
jgi:hypothetical protein